MHEPDPLGLLSKPARTARSSVIRDLLEHAKRPGVISLAGGIPDPNLFPMGRIDDALRRALGRGPGVLQYGLTPGELEARSALSALVGRSVDPERVVVTTGSQQGLDLIAKVLVDPGDEIAVGDPSYLGALQAFRSHRAVLRPLPVDEAGLAVDVLEEWLVAGHRPPAFVYTVSNFDNPTGVVLSAPRRRLLVDLAERYGFLVVEDDPYGMLRYSGVAQPELGAGSEHVVRLRSSSKVLAPGLRVGWIEAPDWLVHALVIAKQSADLHTSTLSQAVTVELLDDHAWFGCHLEHLRSQYGARRDALCAALDDQLGHRVEYLRPDGGMFVWATISGVDTTALLPAALDAGVAYVPASGFGVEKPRPSSLRLSFVTASPAELEQAVGRLVAAIETSPVIASAAFAEP